MSAPNFRSIKSTGFPPQDSSLRDTQCGTPRNSKKVPMRPRTTVPFLCTSFRSARQGLCFPICVVPTVLSKANWVSCEAIPNAGFLVRSICICFPARQWFSDNASCIVCIRKLPGAPPRRAPNASDSGVFKGNRHNSRPPKTSIFARALSLSLSLSPQTHVLADQVSAILSGHSLLRLASRGDSPYRAADMSDSPCRLHPSRFIRAFPRRHFALCREAVRRDAAQESDIHYVGLGYSTARVVVQAGANPSAPRHVYSRRSIRLPRIKIRPSKTTASELSVNRPATLLQ